MRDKDIQRYMDKEFTEKAWLEMNKMLDLEMPVENKKRRAAVWFWMAAGILLLLSSGILLWSKDSTSPKDEFKEKIIASNIQENNDSKNSAIPSTPPASIEMSIKEKNRISTQKVTPNNLPKARTQNTDAPINTPVTIVDPDAPSLLPNEPLDKKTIDSSRRPCL